MLVNLALRLKKGNEHTVIGEKTERLSGRGWFVRACWGKWDFSDPLDRIGQKAEFVVILWPELWNAELPWDLLWLSSYASAKVWFCQVSETCCIQTSAEESVFSLRAIHQAQFMVHSHQLQRVESLLEWVLLDSPSKCVLKFWVNCWISFGNGNSGIKFRFGKFIGLKLLRWILKPKVYPGGEFSHRRSWRFAVAFCCRLMLAAFFFFPHCLNHLLLKPKVVSHFAFWMLSFVDAQVSPVSVNNQFKGRLCWS